MNVDKLFSLTNRQGHSNIGWFEEQECVYFQEGLRSLSANESCTMETLMAHFGTYFTSIDGVAMDSIQDFCVWWIDKHQSPLNQQRVGHRVFDQIGVHGKIVALNKIKHAQQLLQHPLRQLQSPQHKSAQPTPKPMQQVQHLSRAQKQKKKKKRNQNQKLKKQN